MSAVVDDAVKRPIVRYHGGKWLLAPWIISHFPDHKVYTEPYGGGGSVLLRKPRSYAEVYNDLDGEIVNLFRVLRDNGDELISRIALTPFARDEFLDAYEPSDDRIEQARRTVVRSRLGFGSGGASGEKTGFRANSNRSGTTPARDWRNLPEAIAPIVDRLRGVCVENRHALEVMVQHDSPQTLHYCDPPYVHSTRSGKVRGTATSKIYRYEMSDAAHRAFSTIARAVKGGVIISGYPCDLYDRELFPDWVRVERPAFADGARDRTEVLWLNAAAQASLA